MTEAVLILLAIAVMALAVRWFRMKRQYRRWGDM